MTLLISFLAATAVFLLVNGATRRDRPARRRRPPRRRPELEVRLRQAGVSLSAARYRATVAGSIAGVFVVGYGLTGTLALAIVPAAVVGFAPRAYYRRRQRKALEARIAAWPEAIRDVLAYITVGSTLHSALVQLGRSGPEPLRPVWRRYAVNAQVLEVAAALDAARDELADPVSDRVIEAFAAAHERGHTVVVDVLRTLADDVTKDLQLAEQIITGQTEVTGAGGVGGRAAVRRAGRAGVVQRRVPRLLPHDGRVRRDLHRRRDGVRRLEADQRHRPPPRRTPRPDAAAEERTVTGQIVAIAVLAAIAAGCLVRPFVRTPMRLGPRLAPYTDRARSRLGTDRTAHGNRDASRCGDRSSPPPPTASPPC